MLDEVENEIQLTELSRLLHDLKLPLTVLQSISDILQKLNEQEELENYIFMLDRNINYMNRLIYSIKDFIARLDDESDGVFVTDIVGYVDMLVESVHAVCEIYNIKTTFDSDFDYMEVSVNWRYFERIILNVIQNSIKHAKYCRNIVVQLKYIDGTVKVIVTDDGKNDGDNYHNESFENSSGEGLYIITSLAKKLNANITHHFDRNGMYFSLEFSEFSNLEILTPIDQLEIEDLL